MLNKLTKLLHKLPSLLLLSSLAIPALYQIQSQAQGSRQTSIQMEASFKNGLRLDTAFTLDGLNYSPAIRWSKVPAQTKSLALTCEDPDAPCGLWVHWLIWNIPKNQTSLEQACPKDANLPNGIIQGINSFNKIGYDGPSPPPGKPHRYFFKLYALNTSLNLRPGATLNNLNTAMANHVLATGSIYGLYSR